MRWLGVHIPFHPLLNLYENSSPFATYKTIPDSDALSACVNLYSWSYSIFRCAAVACVCTCVWVGVGGKSLPYNIKDERISICICILKYIEERAIKQTTCVEYPYKR